MGGVVWIASYPRSGNTWINILLIADEIQTGFARTGKMFALEHTGVKADIVTLAKGLAGGLPLSAVTGRADVMDAAQVGGLGGTYAGNPLACAAARGPGRDRGGEALRARQCHRQDHSRPLQGSAGQFQSELHRRRPWAWRHVRRRAGQECGEPARELTSTLMKIANEKGLILLSCGAYGNVIRFLVPLTRATRWSRKAWIFSRRASRRR